MFSMRLFAGVCVLASAAISVAILVPPAAADTYKLILHGKVVMKDGSPPPHSVGIQRLCSDSYGDAPGPITNKKGEYIWNMDVDNLLTRTCVLQATMAGFVSTSIDISDLNGFLDSAKELPTIVLSLGGADPRTIVQKNDDVPAAARAPWKALSKAVDAGNIVEVGDQAKLVTEAAPKFARGWHTLGIALEAQAKIPEARDAFLHAVEIDPKMTVSWVTLSHCDVVVKDWQGALKAAENVIRMDSKHIYSEVYLHQAVALYELNNLDAAETSIKESLKQDPKMAKYRGEFALGVILAAKGDVAGAKEHIAKYLELYPNPRDLDQIKAYSALIGTPEGAAMKPALEY